MRRAGHGRDWPLVLVSLVDPNLLSGTEDGTVTASGLFLAALKGTNLRGQTPICGFLRKSCGFLRKSAVFCENLRFPNALFSRKRRESTKISENLGLSP